MKVKFGRRIKHGMCRAGDKSPEYLAWQAMRYRCQNPKDRAYRNYGGRGITVCKRWESFNAFYDDMGSRPTGMSIDRINNNGNYSQENCRWTDIVTQNRNRRPRGRFGISGVNFDKKRMKWYSTIYLNGKKIWLGYTDDFFEACCLRKSAENLYWP